MNLVGLVGWSALIAAVATVLGAILLVLFYAKGQPWGTLNDIASVVLMVATMPVAVALGLLGKDTFGGLAWLVTAIGIIGLAGAAIAQLLLVARVRTYERLLPWTLGSGAVVGVWYVLVGLLGLEFVTTRNYPPLVIALAIASGIGFIAIGYGFWRGNERHPVSIVGGLVLLVSSTAFLGWFAFLTLGSGPVSA
jgi:drug/metabolite transporter (DMT)-like permease